MGTNTEECEPPKFREVGTQWTRAEDTSPSWHSGGRSQPATGTAMGGPNAAPLPNPAARIGRAQYRATVETGYQARHRGACRGGVAAGILGALRSAQTQRCLVVATRHRCPSRHQPRRRKLSEWGWRSMAGLMIRHGSKCAVPVFLSPFPATTSPPLLIESSVTI
jgi:hypothetical protein